MIPSTPPKSVPSVILRHDTPDGGWHFDWMILLECGRLMTFRVVERPDEAHRFAGVRLADHRVAYLDYEGEISGGRGRVTRVARGQVRLTEVNHERVVVEGEFAGASMQWTGTRAQGDSWVFERRAM
ncbi:MAG: hypothetical protein IT432_06965 [Phycisphaerales bacterium]|nr:hypothetical protein [Phycisphaerales bacterium]